MVQSMARGIIYHSAQNLTRKEKFQCEWSVEVNTLIHFLKMLTETSER